MMDKLLFLIFIIGTVGQAFLPVDVYPPLHRGFRSTEVTMSEKGCFIWSVLIVILFLTISISVSAGPPFVTNDADPPDVDQWELIFPFTLKKGADGSRSGELVTFDINYGYDQFTQLSIETPIPYTITPDDDMQWGVGDILFEYKRRFGTDASKGYFGVNPQVSFPTGDYKRGLGAEKVMVQLPLIYQKQWDMTLFYTDLRYKWLVGDEKNSFWFAGFAVEREVISRVEIGAEIYSTSSTEKSNSNMGFNAGLKYGWDNGKELLLSLGRSFRGDPEFTLFAGITIFINT